MSSSASDVIRVTEDGPVRILTINRPDAHNAVDAGLHRRLTTIWREIADDRAARAVVLTGSGDTFCAGGDFAFMAQVTEPDARWRTMEEGRRIILEMLHFPLPVVAAVNGPAVGLGASLAVMTDIVLIADTAHIADPHVAAGLVTGDGGAATWPAHVSLLHAKEFLFLGDRITPDRAVAMGLANRVVPAAELADEALSIARRLAKLPQPALLDTKRALNTYLEQSLAGARNYALAAERYSMASSEHLGFVEKMRARQKPED